jgi:hypothetical protein
MAAQLLLQSYLERHTGTPGEKNEDPPAC